MLTVVLPAAGNGCLATPQIHSTVEHGWCRERGAFADVCTDPFVCSILHLLQLPRDVGPVIIVVHVLAVMRLAGVVRVAVLVVVAVGGQRFSQFVQVFVDELINAIVVVITCDVLIRRQLHRMLTTSANTCDARQDACQQ